jgi:putative endonuclease
MRRDLYSNESLEAWHEDARAKEISALLLRLHAFQPEGTLYVGVTDDLRKRILQHQSRQFDGFTKKYNVNRLMYFETYTDSKLAASREAQIKKYRREKKIALFTESNPQWKDLTPEIFQTIGIPPVRSGFQRKEAPFTEIPNANAEGSLWQREPGGMV